MDKLPSLVIIVGGIVLAIYGASAPKPLRDDLPEPVANPTSDKPVWLLIGGTVVTLAGLIGLLHGSLGR